VLHSASTKIRAAFGVNQEPTGVNNRRQQPASTKKNQPVLYSANRSKSSAVAPGLDSHFANVDPVKLQR
jgi:hypothetical protein